MKEIRTADAVVLALDYSGKPTHVLLIRGKFGWALPGGKSKTGETTEETFVRELEEETGLIYPYGDFIPVGVFDKPGRDHRGNYVTTAFLWVVSVLDRAKLNPVAADDAKELIWSPLNALPVLAFDHKEIIEKAVSIL